MAETREMLAAKFEVLFPHLDERQRRLLMGAEARVLGHGGIRAVARAAGVREATVSAGVDELDTGAAPLGRARRPGGGRKRLSDVDPGLRPALLALVEPDERGDPTSPLRWTTKSTRTLAAELTAQGHRVGADTVADLLRQEGFSLQANTKTIEGKQHPDRDAQFRYLNEQIKDHQDSADPVISVDTKKKELVGQFTNAGQQWRPKGEPVRTRTHDFPDDSLGKAVPYGIYDLTADAGWVNVGTDHDTAAFAVESIRRWWNATGRSDYPNARRLLLTADAGGSNGYRTRAWKAELAALAVQTGLEITVCHFPPGTSKWNKSVWPLAATPGAMKCGGVRAARRVPVGRGRRLDLGVCEPETSLARGPEGPGSVAASTNPRFFSDLVPPRRVDLDPRRSGGTDP